MRQRSSRYWDESILIQGDDEGIKVGFGVVTGLNKLELMTRRHDRLPERAAEVKMLLGN